MAVAAIKESRTGRGNLAFSCAASGNGAVNGQYPTLECRYESRIQPLSKHVSLRGVSCFSQQYPELEFLEDDDGQKHLRGVDGFLPFDDVGVRAAGPGLAKLRQDVRIDDVHQSNSAALAASLAAGAGRSGKSASGSQSSSAIVFECPCPTSRRYSAMVNRT